VKSLLPLFIALACGSGFYPEDERGHQKSKPSFAIHDKVAPANNSIRRTKTGSKDLKALQVIGFSGEQNALMRQSANFEEVTSKLDERLAASFSLSKPTTETND